MQGIKLCIILKAFDSLVSVYEINEKIVQYVFKSNLEFVFQLSRYQHYSASLLSSQDKYYEHQKQAGSKKLKRKKLKDGMLYIQLYYK